MQLVDLIISAGPLAWVVCSILVLATVVGLTTLAYQTVHRHNAVQKMYSERIRRGELWYENEKQKRKIEDHIFYQNLARERAEKKRESDERLRQLDEELANAQERKRQADAALKASYAWLDQTKPALEADLSMLRLLSRRDDAYENGRFGSQSIAH